jgi:hypothetical protein
MLIIIYLYFCYQCTVVFPIYKRAIAVKAFSLLAGLGPRKGGTVYSALDMRMGIKPDSLTSGLESVGEC